LPGAIRLRTRASFGTIVGKETGTVPLRERHKVALWKKARRGFSGYPVATVAFYGADDKVATKVSVGIIRAEGKEPFALERWFSDADVRNNHDILEKVLQFIRAQGAKTVAMVDRIIGCPHEEGTDYPEGTTCPRCPFWAHRDRWTGETVR
jgi:hypothetical protein